MDLCHPAFHPRIHCDQVSADGYDITNLVSADPRVRARGFRAEYFIKPPVSVILSFPFHAHIHRIDIDPSVGSSVSLGFQILTHSAATMESWLANSEHCTSSAPLSSAVNPDTFTLVGKAFLEERRLLCFKNSRYSPRHPFVGKDFLPISIEGNVYETSLWQKSLISLNKVSHVMVRIIRTQSASIPVLRSIRVYGQPSAACNPELIRLVYQISQSLKAPPVDNPAPSPQAPPCKEERSQDTGRNVLQDPPLGVSKDTSNIPLDFLDELTFELMVLPMMLPSGHSVDQSTLDKHSQSEEVWGRPPSNPFTGVPFTRHSHPVPNTALKVRIDKFLLTKGKDLHHVGRTVGRRTRSVVQTSAITNQNVSQQRTPQVPQVSSVRNAINSAATSGGVVNISNSVSISNQGPNMSGLTATQEGCSQDDASRFSGQSGNLSTRYCSRSDLHSDSSDLGESSRKRPKLSSKTQVMCQPCSQSHEDALSQSLDAALARTLGSAPTFTRKRKQTPAGQVVASSVVAEDNQLHNAGIHGNITSSAGVSGNNCCRCNSPAAPNSCNLLQLPCLHLICRSCLLQVQRENKLVCTLCQKGFQTREVVTVHL